MPLLVSELDDVVAADAYLTDGRALYRVVSPLQWSSGGTTAVLEDCHTLQVRRYSTDELWRMRLRRVALEDGRA